MIGGGGREIERMGVEIYRGGVERCRGRGRGGGVERYRGWL